MNPEVKKKWIDALRSGHYRQGEDCLKLRMEQNYFCCLGVLCDIYINEHPELEINWIDHDYESSAFINEKLYLPEQVREWVNLETKNATYINENGKKSSLDLDNDNGKTFNEISDIIEKYF